MTLSLTPWLLILIRWPWVWLCDFWFWFRGLGFHPMTLSLTLWPWVWLHDFEFDPITLGLTPWPSWPWVWLHDFWFWFRDLELDPVTFSFIPWPWTAEARIHVWLFDSTHDYLEVYVDCVVPKGSKQHFLAFSVFHWLWYESPAVKNLLAATCTSNWCFLTFKHFAGRV